MNRPGSNQRTRRSLVSSASSSAHQLHGSHANPASAKNQSVAAQLIIQPLSEATIATKTEVGADNPRCRARRAEPAASTHKCTIDSVAAFAAKPRGSFQIRTTQRLMKIENVPP